MGLPKESPGFLLCAGTADGDDPRILRGLETLVAQGRARVISRYIFEEEEKLLFAASDMCCCPTSNISATARVLSRAGGAGKPVIASDEELVGKLVKKYNLGLLFPSGDVIAFRSPSRVPLMHNLKKLPNGKPQLSATLNCPAARNFAGCCCNLSQSLIIIYENQQHRCADMVSPKNILIIRLKSIGDVALTLPAVNAIRGNFPPAKITFLTSKENADLLRGFREVNEVIVLNRAAFRTGSPMKVIPEFFGFLRQLRRGEFDLVVDLQGYGETAWFTRITGASQRWTQGYSSCRSRLGLYATDRTHPNLAPC
ncbi:MAG: hypothetical protein WDM76_13740 [Limisphaerales bacterium]